MRSIENSRVLSRRWLFHIIPRSRGLPKKGKSALDREKYNFYLSLVCGYQSWYWFGRMLVWNCVSMASAGTVIPERGGTDKRGGEIQIRNQYNRNRFIVSGLFIASYAKIIYVLRLVYPLQPYFLIQRKYIIEVCPQAIFSPHHPAGKFVT